MSSYEPAWPAQVDLTTKDILRRLNELEYRVKLLEAKQREAVQR